MATHSTGAVVMVSINCKTMAKSARKLEAFLEAKGIPTWLCMEMEGGVNYRTEIVQAVESCYVFVPLINDAWASSGECEFEYNYATRLNLTSHETKRTSGNQPRRPVLLPVAFNDLDWGKYPNVKILAASTNFMTFPDKDFENAETDEFFGKLCSGILRNLGLLGYEVKVGLAGKTLASYTIDDVALFLTELSLESHIANFKESGIDGKMLMELTPEELTNDLGVTNKFHAKKILGRLNELKEAAKAPEKPAEKPVEKPAEVSKPAETKSTEKGPRTAPKMVGFKYEAKQLSYFFKGAVYQRYSDTAKNLEWPEPVPIAKWWPGVPNDIDCVLPWKAKTYFFKGDTYYRWCNTATKVDYTAKISKEWPGLPDNLDAAVSCSNGKSYFFKGDSYWRWNNASDKLEAGPMKISAGWPGLPDDLDMAMTHATQAGAIYFGKGSQYWRWNLTSTVDAMASGYPMNWSVWGNKMPLK